MASPKPAQRVLQRLSEREVAPLIAAGLINRQIAQRLVITERTAGAHVEHILQKLEVRSRSQIAALVSHDEQARA